jgi:hypothetical protein
MISERKKSGKKRWERGKGKVGNGRKGEREGKGEGGGWGDITQ